MERDGDRCNLSCLGPRALAARPQTYSPCGHVVRLDRLLAVVVVKDHRSIWQRSPLSHKEPHQASPNPKPRRNLEKVDERFSQEIEVKAGVRAGAAS